MLYQCIFTEGVTDDCNYQKECWVIMENAIRIPAGVFHGERLVMQTGMYLSE